jgi:hypothetical protein
MWPDVPFRDHENGLRWPEVALCLWSLAPRLAPQSLISFANVRTIKTQATCGSSRSSPDSTRSQLSV